MVSLWTYTYGILEMEHVFINDLYLGVIGVKMGLAWGLSRYYLNDDRSVI